MRTIKLVKKLERMSNQILTKPLMLIILISVTFFLSMGKAQALSLAEPETLPTQDYYTLTPDYRKCVSPMCGGFWVKKVNLEVLACPDGTKAAQCYVSSVKIDGNAHDIADGATLVHGKFEIEPFDFPGTYYRLIVDAVHKPLLEILPSDRGMNVLIYNTGIVCITEPCPSTAIALLNTKKETNFFEYDFSSNIDKETREQTVKTIWKEGALVDGVWKYRSSPTGLSKSVFVIQNVFNAKPSDPDVTQVCGGLLGLQCGKGEYCNFGPSCGAADQLGVCNVKPQACIEIYDPVCGCDGKTYGNACSAASHGVSIVHKGECGTVDIDF